MPVLTPQADDFPRWYQDVLAKAQLAENGPVRGTMVIRPYGYSLWERMQAEVDARIKACGAENAYFPLFIPESYLQREDARDYTVRIASEVYEDFMVNVLAMPVVVGLKTARERFAGATNSIACEAM